MQQKMKEDLQLFLDQTHEVSAMVYPLILSLFLKSMHVSLSDNYYPSFLLPAQAELLFTNLYL